MGHLHICYIIYSICIERRKCILPSWPQIYKPHDVINGCYVIFGYPIKSQNWLKCTQTVVKCPRKRPQMHITMPSNAHKDAAKMHTKTHMPSSCTITTGIWNHVQLACLVDSFFTDHGDHYWSFACGPLFTGGFPSRMASNVRSVSMWWFHYHKLALSGWNIE